MNGRVAKKLRREGARKIKTVPRQSTKYDHGQDFKFDPKLYRERRSHTTVVPLDRVEANLVAYTIQSKKGPVLNNPSKTYPTLEEAEKACKKSQYVMALVRQPLNGTPKPAIVVQEIVDKKGEVIAHMPISTKRPPKSSRIQGWYNPKEAQRQQSSFSRRMPSAPMAMPKMPARSKGRSSD